MEHFRTPLIINPSSCRITTDTSILTIGSCFAHNIGILLQKYKFPTLSSPFGTVYNPSSIHKILCYACNNELPKNSTYGESNALFFNYDFHSSFSALHKAGVKRKIAHTIHTAHQFLHHTQFILITYGTAWVYTAKNTQDIVSNCHKVPQKHFTKNLLNQEKILASFNTMYEALKKLNPQLTIILTVSPVRHLSDTLELNAVSKSALRLACHTITQRYRNTLYFPAYEIMMDDLRDYRFYTRDLIHPSEESIDYIWKRFTQCYCSKKTQEHIEQWKKIMKSLSHRPIYKTSKSHQEFLKKTLQKLEKIQSNMDVSNEISLIKKQIIS